MIVKIVKRAWLIKSRSKFTR